MTRYFMKIDRTTLGQLGAGELRLPEGFHIDREIWGVDPVTVEVEDEGAGPECEGKLVEPVFQSHYAEDGSVESVEIISRSLEHSW